MNPLPRKPIHQANNTWNWKQILPELRNLFQEFCASTTIHGLAYIGVSKSLLGRLGWSAVTVLSLVCCGTLIRQVYDKWDNNPVIVSVDGTPTPVWKIPFPAITICPEDKISAKAMNFTERFFAYFYSNTSMSQLSKDQLMAVLQDMFNDGVLHDEYQYLTETKSATNWSMEKGYAQGTPFVAHPLRSEGYATRYCFNLVNEKSDVEAHCTEGKGFRMVLHSPDEYPIAFSKYVLLSLDRDIIVAVKPQILTTSKELANYASNRRKCLFSHERKLRFFRVYNQNNCELECFANLTLARCGCVKFSMPRSAGTRVCRTAEIRCVIGAHRHMLAINAANRLKSTVPTSFCNCMSACSSIQYQSEITQSTYDYMESIDLRIRPLFGNHSNFTTSIRMSKVSIHFKEAEFLSMRRGELFGLTDFIANCGGVLGLCLGVSFVSLVELLYYCVARPLQLLKTVRNNVIVVKDCVDRF
ncbi:pickpocket protein 28-like [Culex pipiens pallens]|uniref:pickpocket protein 28-like n=1 Tax=Culex pipiens pallens TaxID=42434 RepID=UPI001952F229|nr:pickpocket protein 28-like [Culex pipiens pallens]